MGGWDTGQQERSKKTDSGEHCECPAQQSQERAPRMSGGKRQRPAETLEPEGPGRPWDTSLNGEAGSLRGGRGYNGGGWGGGGKEGNEKLTGEEGERSIKNLSVHNTKCQGL